LHIVKVHIHHMALISSVGLPFVPKGEKALQKSVLPRSEGV